MYEDRFLKYSSIIAGIGAAISFIVAILLVLSDMAGSASIMAGMTIALALIANLPRMETFRAFGIMAKMRSTIDEAQTSIQQLRDAGTVTGKIAYFILTHQNRWSDGGRTKQALADEIDSYLKNLGITDKNIEQIKLNYVNSILFDLSSIFQNCSVLIFSKQKERSENPTSKSNLWDSDLDRINKTKEIKEFLETGASITTWGGNFAEELDKLISKAHLLDDDLKTILFKLKTQFERVGSTCKRTGRRTDEADSLLKSIGEIFSNSDRERSLRELADFADQYSN
jgi:hypothetical protein